MAQVKKGSQPRMSFKPELEVHGLDEALAAMDWVNAAMTDAARETFAKIGMDLLGKAVRDAPVDLGDLRGSGYAVMGDDGEAVLGYGNKDGGTTTWGNPGPNTAPSVEIGFGVPYARRQHEELEWKHPRGGRAKYLEANVNASASLWVQWLAEALKWRLGG